MCRTSEKYQVEKTLDFIFQKLKRHLSCNFVVGTWEVEQKYNNIQQQLIPIHHLIPILFSVKPY